MIADRHPFFFLRKLFDRSGARFQFSRYVYTSDSLFDERETFEVAGTELTVEWLEAELGKLQANQELAIHSKVTIDGRTWHIPMIDFAAEQIGPQQFDRIRAFLPRPVFSTAAYYHSGRSFHAYSTRLLGPKEWHEFLGRLLLINPRDATEIVDTRWIGHRIIAGYCSLRFSSNTNQYRGMPRRIGIRAFVENLGQSVTESQEESWAGVT